MRVTETQAGGRFVGPAERVPAAPGVPWSARVLVVDDDGRPIGHVEAGDLDAGTFAGGALDGHLRIRQLCPGPATFTLDLTDVAVGGAGGALERLIVVAEVALGEAAAARGITRIARLARADGDARANADRHASDPVDAAFTDDARAQLESHVRSALAAADAGAARDGSIASSIAPDLPAAIGDAFELRAVRVDRAAWAGGEGEAVVHAGVPGAATEPGASGRAAGDPDPDSDHRADDDRAAPGLVDLGAGAAPGFADAPLRDHLGSSPLLADAWRRRTGGDPAAIGAFVQGADATVLALLERPDDAVLTAGLLDDLGAQLQTQRPRLILLPEAPTLRALIGHWLGEQALPEAVTHAIVEDAARSRAIVELAGEGAAAFVERIATDDAADLGALGAVLPWGLSLRATGAEGVVVAPRRTDRDLDGDPESEATREADDGDDDRGAADAPPEQHS